MEFYKCQFIFFMSAALGFFMISDSFADDMMLTEGGKVWLP